MKVERTTSFISNNGTEGQINIGTSSWSDKEKSVKFAYLNKTNKRPSRGCPELAPEVVIAMLRFMKANPDMFDQGIQGDLAKIILT